MSDFHNVRFPLSLAFGASGGPSRRTDITQLASGAEHRNTPHAQSRRHYNAGAGVTRFEELQELISFFEARFGQLYSFRFRDPLDFQSCKAGEEITKADQIIGEGDDIKTDFELIKRYADAAGHYDRRITKPVAESVKVAIDGAEIVASEYTLDDMSGRLIFNTAPPPGSVISCGFEFDVAVRFDTDRLDLTLEAFGAGQAVNIPLIEVIDHA